MKSKSYGFFIIVIIIVLCASFITGYIVNDKKTEYLEIISKSFDTNGSFSDISQLSDLARELKISKLRYIKFEDKDCFAAIDIEGRVYYIVIDNNFFYVFNLNLEYLIKKINSK